MEIQLYKLESNHVVDVCNLANSFELFWFEKYCTHDIYRRDT